jgi:hypothetical protein
MKREERKKDRKKDVKERNRENTDKWKVIYTRTDVQVETSSGICKAVTAPRNAACLWIFTHMAATPSFFHLASPPMHVLL